MIYMDYSTFARLYSEAMESDSLDLYIGERGFQEWMNNFRIDQVGDILKTIFFLSKASLKEIREKYGYSRLALSRKYYIPARTLQEWENGNRTAPPYVTTMLYYTFFLDSINSVEEYGDDFKKQN